MNLPAHIRLTPQEIVVARHLCEGMSNADIAVAMKIANKTVRQHLYNLFNKTGHGTRLELVTFFHQSEIGVLQARIANLEAALPSCPTCEQTATALKRLLERAP